ncbi:hypothetical protein ACO22_01226 [Paracoccidioides brasiliensis]|uniref:Large ribosomal subunit protein mL59 domain-containing protein n=1 Tax=Paracoccidioides brasiliensis TaxID=121759 RepID=A0A1D2JMH8_PARBR|nr:hypothetical protein ACO22_01226 [Paracoccidioides brasiliensis]
MGEMDRMRSGAPGLEEIQTSKEDEKLTNGVGGFLCREDSPQHTCIKVQYQIRIFKPDTRVASQNTAPMATKQAATGVLENLPIRLRNFFARFPPQIYSAHALGATTKALEGVEAPAPAPSPYNPSRSAKTSKLNKSTFSLSQTFLRSDPEHPNPFLPYKNPETGRWRGAMISLRRQNELVKLAAKYGVEELLPPSRKSTIYKETKAVEKGLRIRGTGIGQKVKGHKWERTIETRLEERRKAMMGMPEMIRMWKQRGHGRGWKKYPRK